MRYGLVDCFTLTCFCFIIWIFRCFFINDEGMVKIIRYLCKGIRLKGREGEIKKKEREVKKWILEEII